MLSLEKRFYTTQDVIKEVGISRLTLYRWLAAGKIPEVPKDYKHHRMFTKKEIKEIKQFKARVERPQPSKKTSAKKWSPQFLALAGSWEDTRSADDIIEDIYAARHDENEHAFHFPE